MLPTTYDKPRPEEAATAEPFFSDGSWCGHLPCVCQSQRGCEAHRAKDPEPFYNPLLPPDPPMKVVMADGGRKYIADSEDAPPEPRQPKQRTGLFQKLFAKCARKGKQSKDQSINATKEGPSSQTPPPEYSAVTKLLPNVAYYPGQAPGKDALACPQEMESACINGLPFDVGSFGTLKPLHASMPYHLAFYHLDVARRHLDLHLRDRISSGPVNLTMYTCSGEVHTSQSSHNYTWSSELYFWRTFMQKQEISYIVKARDTTNTKDIAISMCPHLAMKLRVETNEEHSGGSGVLTASARYAFGPARYRGDQVYGWNSTTSGGRFAEVQNCTRCHCDLEQSLEVRGREVHVRFTVYRDLGPGLDRFHPKWNSLLTGKGMVQRRGAKYCFDPEKGRPFRQDQPGTYGVYRKVWGVAHRLKRPNLHVVTFSTAHGDFTGLS
ncbi:hypothetical protein PG996_004770 [Apiospora saccharicola]|uniref:Uncharacterized protein n=1 Tax=Apiospora saccharicola TaxID=335842 RepID=A0ABR1W548_9PEZI